jgi:sulfonate transport system permease protein
MDEVPIKTVGEKVFPQHNLSSFGQKIFRFIIGIASYLVVPFILVVLWQMVIEKGYVRPILLPPPTLVAKTCWEMAISGELFQHLYISLLRVLEGFGAASAAGLIFGVTIGLSPKIDHLTDLIIQLIKPIPPISWIPLAILWLGIGELSKVYIIFLGAFFPVLVNTIDGIRQTDKKYIELAHVLEVSRKRLIWQVILPGALPAIMTGLRVGLMVGWMCVVAAELIAASSGVGFLIMNARLLSQTDQVLVGMIAIGAMGKILDEILKYIEKRLIRGRSVFRG